MSRINKKTNLTNGLISYRFQITKGYCGDAKEFNRLICEIPIVFSKKEEVLRLYKNIVNKGMDNNNLIELIMTICNDKDVHLKIDKEILENPFVINIK